MQLQLVTWILDSKTLPAMLVDRFRGGGLLSSCCLATSVSMLIVHLQPGTECNHHKSH